jgi:hypothetical protein
VGLLGLIHRSSQGCGFESRVRLSFLHFFFLTLLGAVAPPFFFLNSFLHSSTGSHFLPTVPHRPVRPISCLGYHAVQSGAMDCRAAVDYSRPLLQTLKNSIKNTESPQAITANCSAIYTAATDKLDTTEYPVVAYWRCSIEKGRLPSFSASMKTGLSVALLLLPPVCCRRA